MELLEQSREKDDFVRTGGLLHHCLRNRHTHFHDGAFPILTTRFPFPYNYELCLRG
jgi:hypothetical protein